MNQQQRAVVQQVIDALFARHPFTYSEEIAALRQLLEQPEPVFCEYCGGNDDADFGLPTDHCTDCARPQPAQPADHGDELTIAYLDGVHTGKQLAKREWVGLTNEECIEIAARGYPRWLEFAQAVEAKLREKNGGAA
jgi:hypothetical protein